MNVKNLSSYNFSTIVEARVIISNSLPTFNKLIARQGTEKGKDNKGNFWGAM